MLQDALDAFAQTFTRLYRKVLWRSIGLAIALIVALGIGAYVALDHFVSLDMSWASVIVDVVAALGIVIGGVFLVPPVTMLIAGFFVDDVAEQCERLDFPRDPIGTPVPVARSLVLTLKFFGVAIVVNLIALLLLLVPGVNLIVFYVANGYLLGREYFQLAAMRYRTEEEVAIVRRYHAVPVFLGGLIIALLVSVPILNLITPVFATIFMVKLHKRLTRSRSYARARTSPASGRGPR
ncbi:sulfate transporter family protein [Ancylobacter sp. G4_0304]|uniref:sulfate transporter family protein n=1 Tax=Ancylobacter sp. G4_0304 TaxID=3114289 RepID=UPI0039C5CDF2